MLQYCIEPDDNVYCGVFARKMMVCTGFCRYIRDKIGQKVAE